MQALLPGETHSSRSTETKSTLMADLNRESGFSKESLPPAESFEIIDNEATEQARGLLSDDLEKQPSPEEKAPESVKEGAEYSISTQTKLAFLAIYFALNLVSKERWSG